MRLIDADLLMQDLHHGVFDDCDCRKDYEYLGVDDYIRNQPTAFDLEGVIEQLRQLEKYENPYDSYWESELHQMTMLENATTNKVVDKVLEILKSAANVANGKNGG